MARTRWSRRVHRKLIDPFQAVAPSRGHTPDMSFPSLFEIPGVRSSFAGRLAFLCCVGAVAAAVATAAEVLRFSKLDRSYSDFVEELAPIQMGPAEITLISPRQTLTLLSHSATLEPLGERRFSVDLRLEIEGSGELDARVKMGLIQSRLEDDLELPRQTISGWGEIEIERTDAGYDITLLRSQESIEVEIRSRLAGRIVPLCRQMGLVLIRMDCAALETALSRVNVPLPAPGTRFLLSIEELMPEEVARLEGLLGSAPTTTQFGND